MAMNEKLLHFSIFGLNLAVFVRLVIVAKDITASPNHLLLLYTRFNFRFLTKWTYIMQFIYYTCMVLVHLLSSLAVMQKSSRKLRRFADVLFTTIVIPVGLFITTAFWSIYIIDRDLIFPSWLDEVFPVWLNHALHTFNSVLPMMDLMLVNHKFSSWSRTIFYSLLYLGAYTICFFGTYFQHGIWLYPVFAKMTLPQSICFCLAGYLMVLLFHSIARLISGTVWGISIKKLNDKKNKNQMKKVA